MAGHSKWANIQHRKGAQDARRGKIFTKLIREITVAARLGGGDPAANPRLRHAIDKALAANMPKDNIERAIKRGTGELEGANYEEVRYEGYGPGGVAILVDCQTDNRNRTVGEVRHAFAKYGGNLGTDGSVAYLFKKLGVISFAEGVSEDAVMEAALEAGADDVVAADGTVEVLTSPDALGAVRDALAARGLKIESAEVTERPSTAVTVEGEEAQQLLKLLEALDDLDDVQNVYTNAEFPDAVLARQAS
ncbi:MAG TPA: YebC/PmpR family DNA-binding transcriptional regulator [Burkholderiales bacterium]